VSNFPCEGFCDPRLLLADYNRGLRRQSFRLGLGTKVAGASSTRAHTIDPKGAVPCCGFHSCSSDAFRRIAFHAALPECSSVRRKLWRCATSSAPELFHSEWVCKGDVFESFDAGVAAAVSVFATAGSVFRVPRIFETLIAGRADLTWTKAW